MSRLLDDGARVLVTAKCRRRRHILAELVITADGVQLIRTRHHRAVPVTPGEAEWQRVFGALPTTTPSCPCGRPHAIALAALEAAAAAGVPVVVVDPVRDSMP